MSKSNVDVFVYVMSGNRPQRMSTLESAIGQMKGVVKAVTNKRVKQLLSVKYDPSSISSGEVLSAVKSNGYNATLVGM